MTNARWLQMDELFGEALDVDPSARQAFLARRCGTDDGLRRAVERLLVLEAESTCFLSHPLGLSPEGSSPASKGHATTT